MRKKMKSIKENDQKLLKYKMLRLTPRINSLDYKSKENIPQGKNSTVWLYMIRKTMDIANDHI